MKKIVTEALTRANFRITKINHAIHFAFNDKYYFLLSESECSEVHLVLYEKVDSKVSRVKTVAYCSQPTDWKHFKTSKSMSNNHPAVREKLIDVLLEHELLVVTKPLKQRYKDLDPVQAPFRACDGQFISQGQLFEVRHGNMWTDTSVFQAYLSKSQGWLLRSADGTLLRLENYDKVLTPIGTMKEDPWLFYEEIKIKS